MSVPEGLRGTGRLEVIEKALDLADYTITITANPKIFLPEYYIIFSRKKQHDSTFFPEYDKVML